MAAPLKSMIVYHDTKDGLHLAEQHIAKRSVLSKDGRFSLRFAGAVLIPLILGFIAPPNSVLPGDGRAH